MTTIDWDEQWRGTIADARRCARDRSDIGTSAFLHLVDLFGRRSWRRVLVVGCGISTEPALMAHLGYEVVALDVSSVAIDHITSAPATRAELARWLDSRHGAYDEQPLEGGDNPYRIRVFNFDKALSALDSLHRPGGSLAYHRASFETFTHEAPFDIVYCPRVWQCLDPELRAELPRRAFNWLAPGGACRLVTQNLSADAPADSLCDGRLNELLDDFREAGFFDRHEHYRRYSPHDRDDFSIEVAERIAVEDDARAHARLDGGAKMFDIYNGSG